MIINEFELSQIGPESDRILRNLFEHYCHDMAQWFEFDTEPDGSYSYDTTSRVWQRGHDVYLARMGESLAGFATVGPADTSFVTGAVQDIHEFFVLRRYRRHGIGDAMARRLWNQHPGRWLVRVLEANRPAIPFWRTAIAGYCDGVYEEERRIVEQRPWRNFTFDSEGRGQSAAID